MDSTPRGITYVPQNTTDPAGGLNIALKITNDLLTGYVESIGDNTPPSQPTDAMRFIVGTAPTGLWAGHANDLAVYDASVAVWNFYPAGTGAIMAVNKKDYKIYIYNVSDKKWQLA